MPTAPKPKPKKPCFCTICCRKGDPGRLVAYSTWKKHKRADAAIFVPSPAFTEFLAGSASQSSSSANLQLRVPLNSTSEASTSGVNLFNQSSVDQYMHNPDSDHVSSI